MKIRKIVIYAFLIFLYGCNDNLPRPAETVAMLQEMEELVSVEYIISKVVKVNDNRTWFKLGDRKILITCEAIVKAGINLKDISKKDIKRAGKTITIQLPAPKIISVNLPPEKIIVAFEKVSVFRDPFTAKERNMLLTQAEQQIWNSGIELGIIDQAKINTQLLLSRFLMQLGFEKVLLTYDKSITVKP